MSGWAETPDVSPAGNAFSIQQRHGITWLARPDGGGSTLRARIGAGVEPITSPSAVRLVNISGLNGEVRNIAAMELPAKLFGKGRFKAGDTIAFSSTFATHGGVDRMEWKGDFTLSKQR